MKITLIGTGAYGLALAMMLSKKKDNHIMLWTEKEKKYHEFKQTKQIKEIFPDIIFPDNIDITLDLKEALKDTKLIFLVTSVKYIEDVLNQIKPLYQNTPLCLASKGIHQETLSPLSTLIQRTLKTKNIAVISGPTFAIDLVNNEPAALAIAGMNKKVISLTKDALANNTLKLRNSKDLIGIQLCGSLKNIIAIAAGILKGLGYSESTQAFLINESLHDMKQILHYLNAKKRTILSFAGIGDLLLTCSSTKSRNYTFGYIIGNTQNQQEITNYLKENTVEGYYTVKAIKKMLEQKGKNVPLIDLISDIIENKKAPEELATFLINKP